MTKSQSIGVSIFCTAFNQAEYISKAIESFLSQKCNFKFEILIHDDASTDSTAKIIKSYQEKYPDVIKTVFQSENQYSRGKTIASNYLWPLAKGKYIAWCEGDDYWLDSCKLQKQYNLLESDRSIGLCVHASCNVDAKSEKTISLSKFYDTSRVVDYSDMLRRVQSFATNSFFMRRELYRDYLKSDIYLLKAHGDHKMSLYMGAVSKVYYIHEVMSAYRVAAKGSINRAINLSGERKNIEKRLWQNRCELLKAIDRLTKGEYHNDVLIGIKECEYLYLLNTNQYKEIQHQYQDKYSKENLMTKIRVRLISMNPSVFDPIYRIMLNIKLNL